MAITAPVLVSLNLFLGRLVTYQAANIGDWFLFPLRETIHIAQRAWAVVMGLRRLWKDEWRLFVGMLLLTGWCISWFVTFDLLVDRSFRISELYQDFHLVVATLIILNSLPMLVVMSLMVLGSPLVLLAFVYSLGMQLAKLVYDRSRYAYLSMRSEARPQSAAEAIRVLHSFQSEAGKSRYARALLRWLPVGRNVSVLLDEANQHTGSVRDALFQLAEVWEDSLPETAQHSGS